MVLWLKGIRLIILFLVTSFRINLLYKIKSLNAVILPYCLIYLSWNGTVFIKVRKQLRRQLNLPRLGFKVNKWRINGNIIPWDSMSVIWTLISHCLTQWQSQDFGLGEGKIRINIEQKLFLKMFINKRKKII